MTRGETSCLVARDFMILMESPAPKQQSTGENDGECHSVVFWINSNNNNNNDNNNSNNNNNNNNSNNTNSN